MREVDRILDQLRRAYDGDAWHGPSVRAALDGVDSRMATARAATEGHTIAELVLHVTAWTREVARRLRDGIAREPEDGDWPARAVANESDWTAILAALDEAQAQLVAAVSAATDDSLETRIGDIREPAIGSGVSRYVLLHGVIQHHVYHAGQISLLKRLLR